MPMPASSESLWERVFHQAVQFQERGLRDEAGSLFAAILEHNPAHLPALQRLAAVRRHQGRLEESLTLLAKGVECNPDSAEAHNSLGNTLNSLGRTEPAIESYRRAAALRQDFAEAHFNLGNSLKNLERYQDAADAHRAAIALRPGYADAHNSLGIVLDRLNRPAEAIDSYSAALALDPAIKQGNSNLALALAEIDRHEESLPFFARARQLEPDSAEPVFNEALVQLAMGNFKRGFEDYEARWRVPGLKLNPHEFKQPRWDGRSEIVGKTILLHAEQGLGDTILFARYIEAVAAKGARVIVAVQKPLAPLMSGMPGVAEVVASGDPVPDFDLHALLGSLPLAFQTTVETIPFRTPYLHAPAESETIAGLKRPDDPRPLVGMCWAGNAGHRNDHNRSVPLSILQRLFEVPGLGFVSLQQNLRAGDEAILARFDNIDLAAIGKAKGLADTAALISRLDLVITVDTAIAHLTGALNGPVWVLVPYRPYWVWLRHRTDSPWYPTARLFRQTRIGDWTSVMERVAEALSDGLRSRWERTGR